MHVMGLNVWAVLVCALATMVIGFVWYSPLLFANPWMKLMGYDPNDKAKIAEMQNFAPKEIFRGGSVPEGKYSILMHAVFQTTERTLRDEDVQSWSQQVIKTLESLGGVLRAS